MVKAKQTLDASIDIMTELKWQRSSMTENRIRERVEQKVWTGVM